MPRYPMNATGSKVGMSDTTTVRDYVKGLKANDCRLEGSVKEGHVRAFDGDARVFAAIQKGSGGPWILMFVNSDRITWN